MCCIDRLSRLPKADIRVYPQKLDCEKLVNSRERRPGFSAAISSSQNIGNQSKALRGLLYTQ